jgi:uncharacterized protein YceK
MKTLIIAVVALILSGCGSMAYLTPGISTTVFHQAERACKDHQGLDVVNVSAGGYNAFCNDDSRQDI